MSSSQPALNLEACRRLSLNNRALADFLGCSVRTVVRHNSSGGFSGLANAVKIIRALHPTDPEFASELAASYGQTLVALGLEPDPRILPPPVAPVEPSHPAPLTARSEHADAVVCAAADALNLPPSAVRPAVAAAFARAHELGVGLDTLAPLLAVTRPKARRTAANK